MDWPCEIENTVESIRSYFRAPKFEVNQQIHLQLGVANIVKNLNLPGYTCKSNALIALEAVKTAWNRSKIGTVRCVEEGNMFGWNVIEVNGKSSFWDDIPGRDGAG